MPCHTIPYHVRPTGTAGTHPIDDTTLLYLFIFWGGGVYSHHPMPVARVDDVHSMVLNTSKTGAAGPYCTLACRVFARPWLRGTGVCMLVQPIQRIRRKRGTIASLACFVFVEPFDVLVQQVSVQPVAEPRHHALPSSKTSSGRFSSGQFKVQVSSKKAS